MPDHAALERLAQSVLKEDVTRPLLAELKKRAVEIGINVRRSDDVKAVATKILEKLKPFCTIMLQLQLSRSESAAQTVIPLRIPILQGGCLPIADLCCSMCAKLNEMQTGPGHDLAMHFSHGTVIFEHVDGVYIPPFVDPILCTPVKEGSIFTVNIRDADASIMPQQPTSMTTGWTSSAQGTQDTAATSSSSTSVHLMTADEMRAFADGLVMSKLTPDMVNKLAELWHLVHGSIQPEQAYLTYRDHVGPLILTAEATSGSEMRNYLLGSLRKKIPKLTKGIFYAGWDLMRHIDADKAQRFLSKGGSAVTKAPIRGPIKALESFKAELERSSA